MPSPLDVNRIALPLATDQLDTRPTRNPLAHRAVLWVPAHYANDALPKTRQLATKWLQQKFGQAPLSSGVHVIDDDRRVAVVSVFGRDGTEGALRIQLRENGPTAHWRTTITAHRAGETSPEAVVAVDLECFPHPGFSERPGRPRLIREFVNELKPIDGPARLTTEPKRVTQQLVPALIDLLISPIRRLPMIVAARPVRVDQTWSQRLEKTTVGCAGAASLYILDDLNAVDAFRSAVSEHHRVSPGAIRTFWPEVELGWEADSVRHRLLSFNRLRDPGDAAWQNIMRSVKQAAVDTPLPEALAGLKFPAADSEAHADMRRARDEAVAAAQRDDAQLDQLREQVTTLTELLDLADGDIKERDRDLTRLQQRNDAIAANLAQAHADLDASREDHIISLDAQERLRSQVAALQRRLGEQGRWDEAYAPVDSAPAPHSFEDLLDRIDELTGILFTGTRAAVLALDEQPKGAVWVKKAWQALQALDSYAQMAISAEGFSGGFLQFCKQPPNGCYAWPDRQVSMVEAQTTLNQWGSERIFSVPTSVSSDGKLLMQPHLKIDSKGSWSPRVYFYDATATMEKKVIVGYIGRHLTNTKT